MQALSFGQMASFLKALRKVGVSAARPYLLDLCRHLNTQGAYHHLLSIQLLMRDHLRAALTSIKLSHTTQFSERLKYLEQAKGYLLDGLQDLQERREEPSGGETQQGNVLLSESEVSRYLRTVTLQIDVTKWMAAARNITPPAHLSLFGHSSHKAGENF